MTGTNEPLRIKRYTSRRLYNTETSDYITISEIAEIIRSGRDVEIVDLKTGEDLTRQYLVQIIAEHEARGEHVLPIDVLVEVVRTYNDNSRQVIPEFLEVSFKMYREGQEQMMQNMSKLAHPVSAFEEIQKQQQEFLSNLMGGWTGRGAGEKSESESEDGKQEKPDLEEIKLQLEKLQSMLGKL